LSLPNSFNITGLDVAGILCFLGILVVIFVVMMPTVVATKYGIDSCRNYAKRRRGEALKQPFKTPPNSKQGIRLQRQ
jgi:hypothetical protein